MQSSSLLNHGLCAARTAISEESQRVLVCVRADAGPVMTVVVDARVVQQARYAADSVAGLLMLLLPPGRCC